MLSTPATKLFKPLQWVRVLMCQTRDYLISNFQEWRRRRVASIPERMSNTRQTPDWFVLFLSHQRIRLLSRYYQARWVYVFERNILWKCYEDVRKQTSCSWYSNSILKSDVAAMFSLTLCRHFSVSTDIAKSVLLTEQEKNKMRHDLVVAYLDAQHENKAQEIVAVSCLIRLIFVLRTTRNFHKIFLYCQLSENLRNIVIIYVLKSW